MTSRFPIPDLDLRKLTVDIHVRRVLLLNVHFHGIWQTVLCINGNNMKVYYITVLSVKKLNTIIK